MPRHPLARGGEWLLVRMLKARRKNLCEEGRYLHSRATGATRRGTWEVAPKEEGEIWLEVKCTGDGVIKSAELKETKGSSKPLQYVAEPDDEEAEEEFTYCFLLAKVEKLEEPLPEDGNLPSLVSVKQYALGAVYCGCS